MTICDVPNVSVTEMWLCVCLVLLVQGTWTSSLPIQEELSASINATDKPRTVRQLQLIECCPCPKKRDAVSDNSGEVLEALSRDGDETTELSDESKRDVVRGDTDGVAGCSCQLRNSDSAAAASKDLPRKVSPLWTALTRPSEDAPEDPSILNPEVSLASSVLETLREATEEEYRDAVDRAAQRSQTRSRDPQTEANNNVVTIIVAPTENQEDEALTEVSDDAKPKSVLSQLGSRVRSNKPVTSLIRNKIGLPSSSLKNKNFVNSRLSSSEVNKEFIPRQGENDNNDKLKKKTVKQSDKLARDNILDSSSSASENVEIITPPDNEARSNTNEESQFLTLGRSSISDDLVKLKNVKHIVGEREIKLKVPYLKVPSLINKDSSSRSSGLKIPTLSELFEDIISPTINVAHKNKESVNRPQLKEEAKKVETSNNENESDYYDDKENKKYKTRILNTLPNPSQTDESNAIPSSSFTPSPLQPLEPVRENVEDDYSSQELDDFPNDPEVLPTMSNPITVDPMSSVFIPDDRSSNEMKTFEQNFDDSSIAITESIHKKSSGMQPHNGAILERLDKLSKISNDLEKIKDIVEDMSKSNIKANQQKSADTETGASERHESILPRKVNQAPQTISHNLKKLGDKLRLNKNGLLGASSDRMQSFTLPRLSDLTSNPFDVFNLMIPQDRILQPSFIDRGQILPLDLNNLRARAVPELPSVDEIRDRISDFIGRSGLGIRTPINTLSDMDDDSNTNHPLFALGKPRGNQQTELVDLDVFRLRPLQVFPSSKSRSQQPIQGFNLEKFKAKVQVPAASVKAVELQSTFGKDGRIVGGRFSLQPPNDAFWNKVRNTSNNSKKQPTSSLDALKSDLKSRTDNILESVKSKAPILSSPSVGRIRSEPSLTPLQKTSSSIVNEVRKRVDNVLGAPNVGQRDTSIKDTLFDRKAIIEDKLKEFHSDLVQQINNIEPISLKNTRSRTKESGVLKNTGETKTRKTQMSSTTPQLGSDRTRLDVRLKATNQRGHNVNNAKSTQPLSKKIKTNARIRHKDAEWSPSDTVTLKSMPDKNTLKRINYKDDKSLKLSQSTLKQAPRIGNKKYFSPHTELGEDNFQKKASEINFKSSPTLLRSALKRKNLDNLESTDSSTVSSIPSIRNLRNRSHKALNSLRTSAKLNPEQVILRDSQPKEVAGSDEKLSDAAFEKFNDKLQSRLADIDARAKNLFQNSKQVKSEEPQQNASENRKRISLFRPIKQETEENIKNRNNNVMGLSTASTNGTSWQKLTERIQSRLSEADAAVKKSFEKANLNQRSKIQSDTLNDMAQGASEIAAERLNLAERPLKKLPKSRPVISDLSGNLKLKFSDANEALKQAVQNAKYAKDSDSSPSENFESRSESNTFNRDDGPLAKLTEKLHGRLSETGTAVKNILQGPKSAQPEPSKLEEENDNFDSKKPLQDSLQTKTALREKLSKRLQTTKFSHSSDLEQRTTESEDLTSNKELVSKSHGLPLDNLREKLQSRLAETDKAFRNSMKGSGIVSPLNKNRNLAVTDDFGTENISLLEKSRPLLDKITERMQNRNFGGRNTIKSPEIEDARSGRDGSEGSDSTNIMKVTSVPLLERLAEKHRLSTQPLLGAAPTYIGDMNEEASENVDFTNSKGLVPKKSPLLGELTKKINSRIFRGENLPTNVEDELMVPNASDNVQVASRNSNKLMKQNVAYRCRMVCEEELDKK